MRAAFVVGAGVVCPLAVGAGPFVEAVRAGRATPLVRPRARDGVPVPPGAHAFADPFDAEAHVDRRLVRKVSEATRTATVAAGQALAGLDPAATGDASVHLGTCLGSAAYHLEYHEELRRDGPRAASALLFSESVFNAASGHVARIFGLRGANHTLVGGEDVGLQAVLLAADHLRAGAADLALAGGVEEYSDLAHASIAAAGIVGDATGSADGPNPPALAEGACLLALATEATRCLAGSGRAARVVGGARGPLEGAIGRAVDLAGGRIDLVVRGGAGGPTAHREARALARRLGPVPTIAPKTLLGEGFGYTSAALALLAADAVGPGSVRPVGVALAVASTAPGWATAVVFEGVDR